MLTVKKTKRLDNKKPVQVARKFRIDIEDVRELQRGETVELEDALARTLKRWGMVAYVIKPVPVLPLEPKEVKLDCITAEDVNGSADDKTQLKEGDE